MAEKQGVNVLDSLSDETPEEPVDEGQNPGDRPALNVLAEKQRKSEEENANLRQQVKTLMENEERRQELLDKPKKTASELSELEDLTAWTSKIESDPEGKKWLAKIRKEAREEAEKVFEERSGQSDEKRARSLAISLAEKEGVEPKDFGDQIADILDDEGSPRWLDLAPTERVARAYRVWQKNNKKEDTADTSDKNADKRLPMDGKGKTKAPANSFLDALKTARKTDDFKGLLSSISSAQNREPSK